jgi:hypothetical protein
MEETGAEVKAPTGKNCFFLGSPRMDQLEVRKDGNVSNAERVCMQRRC